MAQVMSGKFWSIISGMFKPMSWWSWSRDKEESWQLLIADLSGVLIHLRPMNDLSEEEEVTRSMQRMNRRTHWEHAWGMR